MLIKLICLLISVALSILGIAKLNTLPNKKYTQKEHFRTIAVFSSIGCFYDIVMFIVIIQLIPPGEYGTGVEVIAMIAVLMIYMPACLITSRRLKCRMKEFEDKKYDVNRMNSLNCSVVFKIMFIIVETIWLVEVK